MRFCAPPGALARYFTSFYHAEIIVPDGGRIVDYLHPEWANLRFHAGDLPEARSLTGSRVAGAAFTATGPSSHAVRFEVGTTRLWGIGLLPLGWQRFVVLPAAPMADRLIDGESDPAFSGFGSLARAVFGESRDENAELARIVAWFESRGGKPLPDEARINAVHAALVDPGIGTVAELAARAGESTTTLNRLCHRAFGFTPKLLLRRQRFMRSLAQFMLDPSLRWIGALDGHYHDQAQFIREFRRFMGMTPGEYAALPHPVLDAFVNERLRVSGSPVQTLDPPRSAPSATH